MNSSVTTGYFAREPRQEISEELMWMELTKAKSFPQIQAPLPGAPVKQEM
jgi:hypothetical protein